VLVPRVGVSETEPELRERIEAAIHALLARRGAGKTICPSEVARAVDPQHWRSQMERVRSVAAELAERGALRVMQRGRKIDPRRARGPIRLSAAEPARSSRANQTQPE
jgi:hypothetical protein